MDQSEIDLTPLYRSGLLLASRNHVASILHENALSETETETETEKKSLPSGGTKKATATTATVEDIVQGWNAIAGVKPCKQVVGKLATRLNGLQREKSSGWWEAFFAEVRKSKFLTGQAAPTNGRPVFRANLFWSTGPENLAKILAGNYDDSAHPTTVMEVVPPRPPATDPIARGLWAQKYAGKR